MMLDWKKYFYPEEWYIAIRKRKNNKTILENQEDTFLLLKNTWRYWCADPFLVEDNDEIFVFFEAYDRLLRKGRIGYRKILGKKIGPIKIIITENCHMSYPVVYKDHNGWVMIPETNAKEKVLKYRAKKFPDIWSLGFSMHDGCVVDTTILDFNENHEPTSFLAYEKNIDFKNGNLVCYAYEGKKLIKLTEEIDTNSTKRPAGNIFVSDGIEYRPSQLYKNTYGEAIIINKILAKEKNKYHEEECKRIYPRDLKCNKSIIFDGTHTYNCSDNYEVVDFKKHQFNLLTGCICLLSLLKNAKAKF